MTTTDAPVGPPSLDANGNEVPAAAATTTQTTPVPPEEIIRQMADNALTKAGNINDWYSLTQHADQLTVQRTARQYQDLIGSAGQMSAADVAGEAAKIWNAGNLPFQIGAVAATPDGNGAQVQVKNNLTGATTTRTYANKDELLKGLQALADPATFSASLAETRKAQAKAFEEQSKPTPVPAGALLVQNSKVVADNNRGYVDEIDPVTGQPTGKMVKATERIGAGAGAGAGRGGSGRNPADLETAYKTIDASFKGGDNPTGAAQAKALVDQLMTRAGLSANQAAAVAIDAVTNPAAVKPTLNARTGLWMDAYANPKVAPQPIELRPASVNVPEIAKQVGADGFKAMAKQMFDAQPPSRQEAIKQSAADPAVLSKNLKAIQASGAPNAAQIAQQFQSMVETYQLANKKGLLETAKDALTAPAAPASAATVAGTATPAAQPAGYVPEPNSPAARAAANRATVTAERLRAQGLRQAAAANNTRMASEQFNRDQASMQPLELARKYDTSEMRSLLPPADLQRLNSIIASIR